MDDLSPRLRAACDLDVAEAREYGGRHEYDGVIQDLSPGGVKAGLASMAGAASAADPLEDTHDEAHLQAFEDYAKVRFGDLQLHRSNPLYHLSGLDLTCYDREYAPLADRARARLAHLAAWPQASAAAVDALDSVSAPVATSLTAAFKGLAAAIPADAPEDVAAAAKDAHARLVAHLEQAAVTGDPDPSLGPAGLTALLSSSERIEVDLGRLAERADAERDRLRERLAASCARIDPARPPMDLVRELVSQHPGADGVVAAAQRWTERAIAFTREHDLVPYHDGECAVGLAPESRRYVMAMMSPSAPAEADAPSWYYITPPDESWPERDQQEWLTVFSDTTLPAITVHEVAPGHFSHYRALRHAPTPVRRTLHSTAFVEGWAHYVEEVCVEEGFAGGDPRFEIGVWLEALVRVTRLACSIGVHSGAMTVADGARRFEADTHLAGPAALAEARRANFDPTYGRYTWGKLEIMDLRQQARQQWGAGFTLQRFHRALLSLGSPPLGLISTALIRG